MLLILGGYAVNTVALQYTLVLRLNLWNGFGTLHLNVSHNLGFRSRRLSLQPECDLPQ